MTSPTQVALRELMILTKCYCDGEHPRLGHNCSFRRDVQTVVAAIGEALRLCEDAKVSETQSMESLADEIRTALLGLPADEGPPWRDEAPGGGVPDEPIEHTTAAYSAQIAERLQRNITPHVSDGEGGPYGTG
jgi:hypothetical protein